MLHKSFEMFIVGIVFEKCKWLASKIFPEKLIKWKSVDKDFSVTTMWWNYFLLALTIGNCFKEFSARFLLELCGFFFESS